MEGPFVPPDRSDSQFPQEAFSGEVAAGSVVLVERMDGDALAGRAGGLGQCIAKRIVTAIPNADPVDRTQDNGLACSENHDAPAPQCDLVEPADGIVGHGTADRRRGVHIERGQSQPGCFLIGGPCRSARTQKAQSKSQHQNG